MSIFPGDRRNDGLKKGASGYGSEGKAEAEKRRLGARENGIAPDQAEPYGDAVADTAQESRENGYTKRAWVHGGDQANKPGVGKISCPCGNAPESVFGDGKDVNCPCGRKYDSRGNILAGPELQNEDSAATGFQSGQETTTAQREDELENAAQSGKCLLCGSDMTARESILEKKLIHFGCWQSSNFDAKLDQMGGRKKLRLENSAGFLTLLQRGSWATRGRENANVRGGSICPDCERGKLRLVVMKSEDDVNRFKCDVCATTFREGDEVKNSGRLPCTLCGGNITVLGDGEGQCNKCGQMFASSDWSKELKALANSDDNTFGESATQIQNRKGKERWDAASATDRLKFLLEASLSTANGHEKQTWDQLRTGAKLALLGYGGGKSIVNADPKADQVARVKQDIADARAGLKLWVDVKGEGRKTLTKEQATALDPATILSITVAQGEKQNVSEDRDFNIASGMWEAMDKEARAAVMKKAGVSGYGFQELDEIHTPHAKQIVKAILSGPRQNAATGKFKPGDKVSQGQHKGVIKEKSDKFGDREVYVVDWGNGTTPVEANTLTLENADPANFCDACDSNPCKGEPSCKGVSRENATRADAAKWKAGYDALLDKMKPLTAKMHALEDQHDLAPTPRGQEPKGPPEYVAVMKQIAELERTEEQMLKSRPTDITNAGPAVCAGCKKPLPAMRDQWDSYDTGKAWCRECDGTKAQNDPNAGKGGEGDRGLGPWENADDSALCNDCSHPKSAHTPTCVGCKTKCRQFVKRDSDGDGDRGRENAMVEWTCPKCGNVASASSVYDEKICMKDGCGTKMTKGGAKKENAGTPEKEPASRYNPDGSIKGQCDKVGCPCALYSGYHTKKNGVFKSRADGERILAVYKEDLAVYEKEGDKEKIRATKKDIAEVEGDLKGMENSDEPLENALRENAISPEQWEMLGREYAKFDTVPMDRVDQLLSIIHSADDAAIKQLASRDIKFISKVARNEMVRRGLKNADAPARGKCEWCSDTDAPKKKRSDGSIVYQCGKCAEKIPLDNAAGEPGTPTKGGKLRCYLCSDPVNEYADAKRGLCADCAKVKGLSNAVDLSPSWLAASLDERATWLEQAGQDINLAGQENWNDLSADVKVALQNEKERMVTRNNSDDDARKTWDKMVSEERHEAYRKATGLDKGGPNDFMLGAWQSLDAGERAALSKTLSNAVTDYGNRHPDFIKWVKQVASVNGKSESDVFKMWKDYSAASYDQSALTSEFMDANRLKGTDMHGRPSRAQQGLKNASHPLPDHGDISTEEKAKQRAEQMRNMGWKIKGVAKQSNGLWMVEFFPMDQQPNYIREGYKNASPKTYAPGTKGSSSGYRARVKEMYGDGMVTLWLPGGTATVPVEDFIPGDAAYKAADSAGRSSFENAESLVRKTWYFDAIVITTGTDHMMQGQVEAFDEADAKKQVEEKALKSGAKGVRSCKITKAYRDNAVENAARFERPCPNCGGMAYVEDAKGNDVKCPKCKGTGVEQVSSLKNDAPLNSFTFVDNTGAEEIVEAENEDEAWVGLAGRMNSTKEEMKAVGVTLRQNAQGDTFFCPKCRAVMTEYTMGVHNRANPTHSVQRLDVNGKVVGAVWAKENVAPEPLPEGEDPIGVATEKQPQIGGVIGIVPEGEGDTMENADDGRAAWESFRGKGDELRQILRELGIKDAADVSYKYWKDVPADVKAKFSARQNADAHHQPNPPRSKNPRVCPSCNEDQEMVKQRGGVEHQPDKCPMKENAVETPAERRNAGTALGAAKYGGAPVRAKIVVPERLNAEDVPCSKCGKPSGLGYTPGAGAKAVCEKCYDAEVEKLTKASEKKNADDLASTSNIKTEAEANKFADGLRSKGWRVEKPQKQDNGLWRVEYAAPGSKDNASEERIIEWPQKGSGKFWLVTVNPSDGSYFPKREATRQEWEQGGKKQA